MRKRISQFALFIAGTLMIGYGAIRGEAATVLGKAIKLCLECVGIPEGQRYGTLQNALWTYVFTEKRIPHSYGVRHKHRQCYNENDKNDVLQVSQRL